MLTGSMLTVDSQFIYALLCLNLMCFINFSNHPRVGASLTKSHSRKVPQQSVTVTLDDNEERIDWIDWVTHARTSKLLYIQNRSVIKKSGRIDRIPIPNPSHPSPKGGTKYLSTIKRGTVICNMHMYQRSEPISARFYSYSCIAIGNIFLHCSQAYYA